METNPMCQCDMLDGPDFFSEVTRRARKPCTCDECRRPIDPGEQYKRHAGKWDGEFSQFVWCVHCVSGQKIAAWLTGCDCWAYTQLWYGLEEEAAEDPDHRSIALYRLIVGARRKWRVRRGQHRGQLMAVPVREAVATGGTP